MIDPLLLVRAAYLAVYAAIFVIDLRTRLIPNVITYPAIVAALVVRPDGVGLVPVGNLIAGVVAALFLYLIGEVALRLRGREGIGMGDVKLALLIGLLSGPLLTPIALWLAFVSGGVVAVALVALRRTSLTGSIAFGPYLALGGATVLLFGRQLLELSGLLRWFPS